jgi:hypothetical protein
MKRVLMTIVIAAAAGVAACGGNEAGTKKEAAATAPAPTAPARLVALLPAKNEVAGWELSKPPRGFNADTLYELINGAADSFIAYGMKEMVTADYVQAGTGAQAVIEIYEMTDALNAFGKYAEERNPEAQFLQVGNEGYSGGTALNFWVGAYYVKVTTFEDKEPVKQELAKLAQAVAAKVPDRGTPPREFSYFPAENQVARTALYVPKDVLAQSYLTNGYEAKYKSGAKEAKLVLVALDSPEAAKDGLARYREAVAKGGKDIKAVAAPGDGGFAGKDSFYGSIAALRAGRHIVVALGFATEEACRKQAGEVVARVKAG